MVPTKFNSLVDTPEDLKRLKIMRNSTASSFKDFNIYPGENEFWYGMIPVNPGLSWIDY